MPAKAASNGAAAPATSSTKRFELPALEFKFGSLTDGTDIPPPLPSPKEEVPSPPKTPVPEEVEKKKQETNGTANGHGTSPNKPSVPAVPANVGVKRPLEDGPTSPAPSSRGSLRRLLSRTLLNNAYDEQGSVISQTTSRPPSRTASTITDEKKSKRSSGWFKRLRTHDNSHKRASQFFEEPKTPRGPPPPMIPELSALETKVDTHLGDDLFKEIK
ncbi:hypothetical protein K449DRAFT_434520 [Hypoxylon sp. EC38]|nr:hypothetical protein K449DRAFT_434520 [Hypoxylon sp. EC38]OTA75844.1 hypothetical protein M434DRAFT_38987 [Hypoxylon sp. CO27-5]